jgi:hypothetical protein
VAITFQSPTHRVQLAWSVEHSSHPAGGHTLTFTVRTLPGSAGPATTFARGDTLYSGTDADAAWEAVRREAPLAPLPKRLERLVTLTTLLRNCAVCGLPIDAVEGRPVLRAGRRGGRWIHTSCAVK